MLQTVTNIVAWLWMFSLLLDLKKKKNKTFLEGTGIPHCSLDNGLVSKNTYSFNSVSWLRKGTTNDLSQPIEYL